MERVLLVVACVVLWAGCVALMLRSMRRRAGRQAELVGELPTVPTDLGTQVLPAQTGLYLGTTLAPSWHRRLVVGDLGDRASATLRRYDEGILLERTGASALWIPRENLETIRTERGHAGKVMTAGGVLVLRWHLPNGTSVDTGFRGDDKSVYSAWVTTANEGQRP